MELRLKTLLEQAQFTKYKGKGYDAAEVDDFLDRATAMAAKVETQLTESMARPGGGSGPTNAEVQAEVNRRVEARLAELKASGGPAAAPDTAAAERAAEDTAEQAHRTLLLAQRTADAAVSEARHKAEQLLADAHDRSTSTITEAETAGIRLRAEGQTEAQRERQEARSRLGEEIRQLETVRETLGADIAALERHLEEQRGRLSSSIGDLQRLLDDPAGFRVGPAPVLVDPAVPDLSVEGPEPDAGAATGEERGSAGNPASEPAADETTDTAPSGDGDGDRASRVTAGTASSTPTQDRLDTADPAGPAGDARGAPADRASGSGDPTDRVVLPGGGQAPAGVVQPGAGQPGELGRGSTQRVQPEGSLLTATASSGVDVGDVNDVDHRASALPDWAEAGPTTSPKPVDLDLTTAETDPQPSDDAFLAELRKAMSDEKPLGPRPVTPADQAAMFGEDRPGWRFGRRR